MSAGFKHRRSQQGFSMIEVLVTLVILMLGLLGLVGLMVTSQRAQLESYQRVQALVLVQDMVNRINANGKSAPCYAVTTATNGATPYLGTGSSITTPTCATGTTAQRARAIADMTAWNNLLLGSAEQASGSNVGAMVGARGCVQFIPDPDPALAAAGSGVYQVSVVWQGSSKTAVPTVGCATGQYGDDAQRRAVTVPVKIAKTS